MWSAKIARGCVPLGSMPRFERRGADNATVIREARRDADSDNELTGLQSTCETMIHILVLCAWNFAFIIIFLAFATRFLDIFPLAFSVGSVENVSCFTCSELQVDFNIDFSLT